MVSLSRLQANLYYLTTMEKIAATTVLDPTQLQKVAAYGFATALSTPSAGLPPSAVKLHTDKFAASLERSGARHNRLVQTIRGHFLASA
jgi:hypothetical protein